MSSSSSNVRSMLRQQRGQRGTARVDHPLATYDLFPGSLACSVCRIRVGEVVWRPHLHSQGHVSASRRLEKEKRDLEEKKEEEEAVGDADEEPSDDPVRKRPRNEHMSPSPAPEAALPPNFFGPSTTASASMPIDTPMDMESAWAAFTQDIFQAETSARVEEQLQDEGSVAAAAPPNLISPADKDSVDVPIVEDISASDHVDHDESIPADDEEEVEEEQNEAHGQAVLRDRLAALRARRATIPTTVVPGATTTPPLPVPEKENSSEDEDEGALDRLMDWRGKRLF